MKLQKRLQVAGAILAMVFVIAVVGYRLLGLEWVDALYMTVITLTTVGFGEVGHDFTPSMRLFTIGILLVGMGLLMYGVTTATAFIVEGELTDLLKRRKMEKKIAELEGHTIVCGLGSMGRYIIEELQKTLRPFVVIDNSRDNLDHALETYGEFLHVHGDASDDAVLEQAGLAKASGVVTTFGDDKMNLFVTLSARNLNPEARIVARAVDSHSAEKLKRSGANSVVSTNLIGGLRLVSELVRPAVTGFLDIMLHQKEKTLRVEEAVLADPSELVGITLADADIQEKTTLAVVALRDGGTGEYIYSPKPDTVLKAGDVLIVMGDVNYLPQLRALCAGEPFEPVVG